MCSAEVGISLPASLPHIHDRVMEAFTEPKVDDPLDLKPSTRTVGSELPACLSTLDFANVCSLSGASVAASTYGSANLANARSLEDPSILSIGVPVVSGGSRYGTTSKKERHRLSFPQANH